MEWATSDTWAAYSPTVLSRDPWVVQFEDFLSADEVQALLEAGSGKAYERSSNVGDGPVQKVARQHSDE